MNHHTRVAGELSAWWLSVRHSSAVGPISAIRGCCDGSLDPSNYMLDVFHTTANAAFPGQLQKKGLKLYSSRFLGVDSTTDY